MKRLVTIILAVASVAAVAAPETDAIVAKRERAEKLLAAYGNACAQVKIYLKLDKNGEPPKHSFRYLCPNCNSYHSRDAETYLREGRPVETCAFAVAPDRFLVQDDRFRADWVERIEVVFGGVAYPAKPVRRYLKEEALETCGKAAALLQAFMQAHCVSEARPLDKMSPGELANLERAYSTMIPLMARRSDLADLVMRYGKEYLDLFPNGKARTTVENCMNQAKADGGTSAAKPAEAAPAVMTGRQQSSQSTPQRRTVAYFVSACMRLDSGLNSLPIIHPLP